MSELTGRMSLTLGRIPPLIMTIQPDPFIRKWYTGCNGFSENFEKRLVFYFQHDQSGWPVLTFGKHPQDNVNRFFYGFEYIYFWSRKKIPV